MTPARINIPNSARRTPAIKRRVPLVTVDDGKSNQALEQASAEKRAAEIERNDDRLANAIRRLNDISEAIQRIDKQRVRDIADLRSLAIQVGTAAAERILSLEMESGRHELEKLVLAAVDEHKPLAPIRVIVNPQDKDAISNLPNVEVVRSDSVERGNFEIEYDEFNLERCWRERLDQIQASLLKGGRDVRTD